MRIQNLPDEGDGGAQRRYRTASKQQVGQAGAMLTRAFSEAPKLTPPIPDIPAKKELSRYLFEFELQYGRNYGDIYTTSPSVEGVAYWLP